LGGAERVMSDSLGKVSPVAEYAPLIKNPIHHNVTAANLGTRTIKDL
jgi:hypothetical protein